MEKTLPLLVHVISSPWWGLFMNCWNQVGNCKGLNQLISHTSNVPGRSQGQNCHSRVTFKHVYSHFKEQVGGCTHPLINTKILDMRSPSLWSACQDKIGKKPVKQGRYFLFLPGFHSRGRICRSSRKMGPQYSVRQTPGRSKCSHVRLMNGSASGTLYLW